MNDPLKSICVSFEREIWLFLDKELSGQKTILYTEHISSCQRCSSLLSDIKLITGTFHNESDSDILDAKFEKMLEHATAVKKQSRLKQFFIPGYESENEIIMVFRVAALAVVTAAAIIFSLSTNNPNPVKNISQEILDWEGEKINEQIYELRKSIIKTENTQWETSIELIDNKIDRLEKKMDINSF